MPWLQDRHSTVTGNSYLKLLIDEFWPQIRRKVNRQLWMQKDSATAHTTRNVRQWLAERFNGRVISRLMEREWPARSPDLSPLNFWFWSVALAELRRNPLPLHFCTCKAPWMHLLVGWSQKTSDRRFGMSAGGSKTDSMQESEHDRKSSFRQYNGISLYWLWIQLLRFWAYLKWTHIMACSCIFNLM